MGLINRIFGRKEKTLQYTTDQIFNLMSTGSIHGTQGVTDAFSQIPTVYACVKTKALNISRVPLLVYKGDKLIEGGPANQLLSIPNRTMSGNELLYFLVSAINLRGNGYAVKDDSHANIPLALWPAASVKPILDDMGFVKYYEVTRGKQKLHKEVEQILHAKFFSPYSMTSGHAPLSVLKEKVELYYAADKYNSSFFKNDATPTSVFKLPSTTPPQQVEILRQQLVEKRKGKRESMVLSGGIEVEQIGISQKDADFLNLYKVTREDICSAFGVPESEIDIYSETKYSNAMTAAAGFWEKTLIPEAEIIAKALSAQVFNAAGLECRFDFNSIDALHNKGFSDKVGQAKTFFDMGIPFQDINSRLNLGFDPDMEVERPAPAAHVPAVTAPKSYIDDGEEDRKKAQREMKWYKLIKSVESIEAKMRKRIKDYFHKVEGKLLKVIGSGKGSSFSVNKDYTDDEIREAFNDKELEDAVREMLEDAITAGALDIAGGNIMAASAEEILEEKLIKVVLTNETSSDKVIDKLREALVESMEAGDGAQATAKKLKEALGDAMDINRTRAETIARTEIGGAFNQAGYVASEDNGAVGTRWISARDSNTRDSHQSYDDGKIRMTGDFYGGKIAYPHEPNAPPEEVINCRCMFEPIYPEDL